MDFSLTEDQKLIRDTVRQFMETEMRPVIREYERTGIITLTITPAPLNLAVNLLPARYAARPRAGLFFYGPNAR